MLDVVDYVTFIMSVIYGECLVNVHFSNIPHTFIPHFTLHSAEKIHMEFSANYPLTTFRNPHSAEYPFPKITTITSTYLQSANEYAYVC